MAFGSVSNVFPGGERPSGLPVDIVQQLVAARRQQVVSPLEADREGLQSQRQLMQQLNGVVEKVGQAAQGLDDPADLEAFSASSSDADALGVSLSGGAEVGDYRVDVSQVAKAQTQLIGVADASPADGSVTQGVADPDDSGALNDGIEVSFAHGGSDYTHTTGTDTTLNDLASEIREEANGVRASVVNIGTSDDPQHVLQLKSEATGAGENRITDTNGSVGVAITDPDGGESLFTDGAAEQETAQAGQDAQLTVDGVAYSRASNEVSDVIEGVTLSLNQATDSEATVSVDRATDQATQKMGGLVQALNKVNSFIDQTTSYNSETGEAGPLLGNNTVRQVDSGIRQALTARVAGTEDQDLQYLSQVGVGFNRDGQVTFEAEQFQEALAERPEEVKTLLTGGDGAIGRLSDRIQGLTNSADGTVTTAIDTLENRDQRLQERIRDAEARVRNYDQRISQQFTELERTVQELQGLEDRIGNILGTSGGNG